MSGSNMTGVLRFDLGKGHVSLSDEVASDGSSRTLGRAVIPAALLLSLLGELSADQVTAFGHQLGHEMGRRLVDRLKQEPAGAKSDAMVDALGSELALMGLGSLALEFWGHALVFSVSHSPLASAAESKRTGPGEALLAALMEGAMARSMSRDVRAIPIHRGADIVRFLICNPRAKERVATWLLEGCHYGEALARLHENAGAA